jgi:hypothetical protein
LPPQKLGGPVGDDFVHVHVARRPGTPLKGVHRKLIAELSGDNFIAGLENRFGFPIGEIAQFSIGQAAGLFYPS